MRFNGSFITAFAVSLLVAACSQQVDLPTDTEPPTSSEPPVVTNPDPTPPDTQTPPPTPNDPPAVSVNGVPQTLDLETPVEVWWASHPYNPESPNFIPVGGIQSPDPVLNVRDEFGGNIQAAIDALPASGGTLYFPPGTYGGNWTLVGKSNVHFISDGGAVLTGVGFVVGCTDAIDYQRLMERVRVEKNPDAINCVTDGRIENIYFKNLTFDGGGTQLLAITIRAARQVLFDNVTFQNYRDPGNYHRGLINATAWVDDIWVRDSRFLGSERWAVYFDGCFACGVIGSEIAGNFGNGGLLILTNQDADFDINGDGIFQENEIRQANHIVVANNTFGGLHQGIQITGKDALVVGNTATADQAIFVQFSAKCDQVNPNAGIHSVFNNLRVENNRVAGVNAFVRVNAYPDGCGSGNTMEIGGYYVAGNTVERFYGTNPGLVVEVSGPIVDPRVITDNLCGGVACDNQVRALAE
ncbi:hypothetical protein Marky_1804 [Marinithermus hydrothermalis DSM 14884]|uniref:Uncharacterized protein n=2 Tax=Marinithermus TaxID=186191 RepID=F2NPN5_MARHT|nr:hypothetical protein Marky_1804 [Marinithermus hydrothermalis DSM 14884]